MIFCARRRGIVIVRESVALLGFFSFLSFTGWGGGREEGSSAIFKCIIVVIIVELSSVLCCLSQAIVVG